MNGFLYKELKEQRILLSDVGYGEQQAFRIKTVDETLNSKKIYATHIFYDLSDNLLEDVYPKNLNGNTAVNWILFKTQYEHNFNGNSDISKSSTARYVRKNVVQALIGNEENSFINRWGGEIVRNNFNISMVSKRQSTKIKKVVRYRKNLQGINFKTDFTTIGTRLMPMGYDALMLPEKYIDSPLINNYPHPIIKILEYSDVKIKTEGSDEGFETPEEAEEELRRLTKLDIEAGVDKPTLSTTIEFVKLADTEEYKDYKNLEELYIGDSILVHIDKIDVEVEQRIIKTTYNVLTGKFIKYELGNVKANYVEQSVKRQNLLQESTLPNLLERAKEEATRQLTTAMGGYVYKTENELFIMDTPDPNTAQKVWRWNLNGLGYSNTGINGTYGIAMTQDGSIVADYITTGTMSVARITGLEDRLNGYSVQIGLNSDSITLLAGKQDEIVEKFNNYSTTTEMNAAIDLKYNEILLNVSKNYTSVTTFEEGLETTKNEAISSAVNSANASTDTKLKSYSTTTEMNAAIDLKYNEITLNVSKTYTTKSEFTTGMSTTKNEAISSANASTDSKLKNYSTTTEMNAAIKLKTDAITLEVNKKVNESDFGTKIEQNYSHIKIAWNNISKYIQFESGELRIYDSASTSSQKLRSVFNYSGEHFYRDDYYVGKIGTNQWASDNSHKGLVFDLDYQGKYMAFSQKESSSSSTYNTMLCFSRANSIYNEYGVHLGCDLYGHYNTLNNFKIGSISAGGYNAYTGAIPIVTRIESGEDGSFSWWHSNLRVYNGIIVGYWND